MRNDGYHSSTAASRLARAQAQTERGAPRLSSSPAAALPLFTTPGTKGSHQALTDALLPNQAPTEPSPTRVGGLGERNPACPGGPHPQPRPGPHLPGAPPAPAPAPVAASLRHQEGPGPAAAFLPRRGAVGPRHAAPCRRGGPGPGGCSAGPPPARSPREQNVGGRYGER